MAEAALGNRTQASGASQPAGSFSEVHRRLPWQVLSMYTCPLQYEWSLSEPNSMPDICGHNQAASHHLPTYWHMDGRFAGLQASQKSSQILFSNPCCKFLWITLLSTYAVEAICRSKFIFTCMFGFPDSVCGCFSAVHKLLSGLMFADAVHQQQ